MTIYVDYIFFINFLFDLILLYGINIILKRNTSRTRLLLGSIFGGLTIFILFISINGYIYFFIKLLLGVIMLLITFSFKSFKYTFTNFIYLILLSIILGGSLFFINNQLGNKSTGIILFTNGFNLNNIIVLLSSLLIIELYSYINKVYKNNISNIYSVILYNKNQTFKLSAYLDTGNNLYDPYFNKPILILNKNINIFKIYKNWFNKEIIGKDENKSKLGLSIIASRLSFLYSFDRNWTKDYIISYIITNIISLIICFAIVSILGRSLINMYSYPEYMVLKKIQISSFIENVENFISLLWLFDLYYLTSYSIKKINGILTTKIGTVLIFLITVIDSFVINNNYEYLLYIYKRVPYILYILVIPILILANKKRVN